METQLEKSKESEIETTTQGLGFHCHVYCYDQYSYHERQGKPSGEALCEWVLCGIKPPLNPKHAIIISRGNWSPPKKVRAR